MASFFHLPISFFVYASLLSFSTLMCLSNASIEQPSSIKPSIQASLESYHDLHVVPPPKISSDILPVSEPKPPRIQAPVESYHDLHVVPPPKIRSDILPVSEPVTPQTQAPVIPRKLKV